QTLEARGPLLPPPGPGPEDGSGPRRGPPRGTRPGSTEDDVAFLQSVLTFYDRFARRNATYPKLQGEAARAYRKVGTLYQRLGRKAQPEEAYARATEKLEALVARYPDDPAFRLTLARSYSLADPWSAAAPALPHIEQQLRNALSLLPQVAPDLLDPVA